VVTTGRAHDRVSRVKAIFRCWQDGERLDSWRVLYVHADAADVNPGRTRSAPPIMVGAGPG
jgi:hypothetical protein